MFKKSYLILLAAAILLTACGGTPAAPTMAPADVQNTAVAAAWTMVAATQQAIPTNTLPPPTETPSPTPLPTFTPQVLASPTQEFIVPPTPTQVVVSDPNNCLKPLDMSEAGPTKRVRVKNATGGTATVSFTLNPPNAFGQCGAISFILKKNDSNTLEMPNGSWFLYAWVELPGGKQSTAVGGATFGDSKSKDLITMEIREDVIKVQFP